MLHKFVGLLISATVLVVASPTEAKTFKGSLKNDTFQGTQDGKNRYIGRRGYDQISYEGAISGFIIIRKSSRKTLIRKKTGKTDTLFRVEGVSFTDEGHLYDLDEIFAPFGTERNVRAFFGTSGNDQYRAFLRRQSFFTGGDGVDTVIYPRLAKQYSFEKQDDGIILVTKPNGKVDRLKSIEYLHFRGDKVRYDIEEFFSATEDPDVPIGLIGTSDADTIKSIAGNDLLVGKAGNDTFVFETGSGYDRIADFTVGEDKIDLSDFGFISFKQLNLVEQNYTVFIVIDENTSVELTGINKVAELSADDFILATGNNVNPVEDTEVIVEGDVPAEDSKVVVEEGVPAEDTEVVVEEVEEGVPVEDTEVVVEEEVIVLSDPNKLYHYGEAVNLVGANIAWSINSRFSSDFGASDGFGNPDTNLIDFQVKFDEIARNGGNSARIWLHTTAQISPHIATDGQTVGLSRELTNQEVVDQLKAVLDSAWDRGILVTYSLFSFDMVCDSYQNEFGYTGSMARNREMLTSQRQAYFDTALTPIVTGLKDHPSLFAYEIFNEPEGMYKNVQFCDAEFPIVHQDAARFVNEAAALIHRLDSNVKVTTSTHTDLFNDFTNETLIALEGANPEGVLDFLELHWYEGWTRDPYVTPKSDYSLDIPIIIGEFDLDQARGTSSENSISDILANGYAGAWPWSLATTDRPEEIGAAINTSQQTPINKLAVEACIRDQSPSCYKP